MWHVHGGRARVYVHRVSSLTSCGLWGRTRTCACWGRIITLSLSSKYLLCARLYTLASGIIMRSRAMRSYEKPRGPKSTYVVKLLLLCVKPSTVYTGRLCHRLPRAAISTGRIASWWSRNLKLMKPTLQLSNWCLLFLRDLP